MEVFVYGTLTDPDRARAVLGGAFEYGPDATLVGLRRLEGEYPTLAPPVGGDRSGEAPRVGGRLLETPDVATLDGYEGVDRGLYVRVTVPVVRNSGPTAGDAGSTAGDAGPIAGDAGRDAPGDGPGEGVEVYVGDPDRLGVGGVEWPGTGDLEDRVERHVREAGVVVRVR